ncbi:MAG: FtsK/SpoIIIE domain-containing protein [Spirochaetes bacterium]|nr:FtsK/SpoIIIE domain-containing protein [Spirochaetota bacterium]
MQPREIFTGLNINNIAERLQQLLGRVSRLKAPSPADIKHKFIQDRAFRLRSIAIAGAAVLGLCGLLAGISILNALFGANVFLPGIGGFLARSYGILALAVPAIFLYAAFILADPRWRPDRIFLLSLSVCPFFTLALGYSFIRDFEFRSTQFAFLDFAGVTGFGFTIVTMTLIQVLVIKTMRRMFFPNAESAGKEQGIFRRRKFLLPAMQETQSEFQNASFTSKFANSANSKDKNAKPFSLFFPLIAGQNGEQALPKISAKIAAEAVASVEAEVTAKAEAEAEALYKPSLYQKFYPAAKSLFIQDNTLAKQNFKSIAFSDSLKLSVKPSFGHLITKETASFLTDENVRLAEKALPDEIALADEAVPDEIELAEDFDTDERSEFAEEFDADEIELAEDDDGGSGEQDEQDEWDSSVERAIEEAQAAAVAAATAAATAVAENHSEQIRKNTANPFSASPKKYSVPLDILNEYQDGEYWIIDQATRDAAVALKETLQEFKIQAEVTGIRKGPVITMFEILPAPGVKLSKIVGLQDNIALRLAAASVRIVAPIPGKHAVGIEIPNPKRNIVSFREIIEGELARGGKRPEIPVVMGKDISGEAQTIDLVQTPHLLIAGSTGSGKSVCVNSMILSILYQLHPAECKLILIDPKIVELKLYNGIPHLLTPVITEPKRAFQALQYCIFEMERRYACLDSMGVRDIRNYNKRIKEKNIAQENMPYIVVVIDEFADLMVTTGKELESTVARLAAMSRAVGIHLVLATQRPSIDVITGLIKANIPSRIAFMVASKMDSRIIIDMVGAEKLLGKGDMLYAGVVDPFPIRMQGAFISEEEVEAVVAHVKTFGEPDYIDEEIFYDDDDADASPQIFSEGADPLYDKALEVVMQQGKASASYIQRRLKIGYNRAARLVEEMENNGVVGPAQGNNRPREILRGAGI